MSSSGENTSDAVFVKLLYCTKTTAALPVQQARKNVKVAPYVINSQNFKPVIKQILKIDADTDLILRRKSRRQKDLVPLESEEDYRSLKRSLKVKNYIKLVAVNKTQYGWIDPSDMVFKDSSEHQSFAGEISALSNDDVPIVEKTPSALPINSANGSAIDQHASSNDKPMPVKVNIIGKPSQDTKSPSPQNTFDEAVATLKEKLYEILDDEYANRLIQIFTNTEVFKDIGDKLVTINETLEWVKNQAYENISDIKKNGSSFRLLKHSAICDGCFPASSRERPHCISGVRYKCLDCDDFDLCGDCEAQGFATEDHAASHTLIKIKSQNLNAFGLYERLAKLAEVRLEELAYPNYRAVHHRIFCDGCGSNSKEPLKGIRYKCLVCNDYYLCEKCESTGFTSEEHNSDHMMAKIKDPAYYFYSPSAISEINTRQHGFAGFKPRYSRPSYPPPPPYVHNQENASASTSAINDTTINVDIPKHSEVGQKLSKLLDNDDAAQNLRTLLTKAAMFDELTELVELDEAKPEEYRDALKCMIQANKEAESRSCQSKPEANKKNKEGESKTAAALYTDGMMLNNDSDSSREDSTKVEKVSASSKSIEQNKDDDVEMETLEVEKQEAQELKKTEAQQFLEKKEDAKTSDDSKPEKADSEEKTLTANKADAEPEKEEDSSSRTVTPVSKSDSVSSVVILPTLLKESSIFLDAESSIRGRHSSTPSLTQSDDDEKDKDIDFVSSQEAKGAGGRTEEDHDHDIFSSTTGSVDLEENDYLSDEYEILDSEIEY